MTAFDPAKTNELALRGWVVPSPTRRSESDVTAEAGRLGVSYAALRAVLEVESGTSGFDSRSRLKILYEPHIAYRAATSPATRAALVAAGVAYPKWGTRPYPKDSYVPLARAYAIDPGAALRACSLGGPQILGDNYAVCGYGSAAEMFAAFALGGEVEQLRAMGRFLTARKLVTALARLDWAAFARGYNGPGYAANSYDKKLAASYARWSRAPAPPPTPSLPVGPVAVAPPSPVPLQDSRIVTRGVTMTGLAFAAERGADGAPTGWLAWSAGSLAYEAAPGESRIVPIAADRMLIDDRYWYVYWRIGRSGLNATRDLTRIQKDPDLVLVATVSSLTGVSVLLGPTLVDGSRITPLPAPVDGASGTAGPPLLTPEDTVVPGPRPSPLTPADAAIPGTTVPNITQASGGRGWFSRLLHRVDDFLSRLIPDRRPRPQGDVL